MLEEICCLYIDRIIGVKIYIDRYEGMVTMGVTDIMMLYDI
jgi:hypothetical protein